MDNVEISTRFFREVMEDQDLKVLDEIIHPQYRARPIMVDNEAAKLSIIDETKLNISGVNGIKERIEKMFTQFSDFIFEFQDIVQQDNKVVFFHTMKFTHIGYWNNFAPTGRRISISGVHLFRFKDNKIIEIKVMVGTIDLLKQIGAGTDVDDAEKVNEYLELLKQYISR